MMIHGLNQFQLIKTQCDGHTINQEWLEKLTLAKARSCLDNERSNSKSMLLLIEFARTMIEDNECTVLYFEPVCIRHPILISMSTSSTFRTVKIFLTIRLVIPISLFLILKWIWYVFHFISNKLFNFFSYRKISLKANI